MGVMELAIRIHVEELPEGLFLATSDELPGLLAQGRTLAVCGTTLVFPGF
jgi:predicted RNase H-like HicB family nuclease